MAVSMYTISAPIFVQILEALSNVISKAQAHCEEKKLDESYFINNRFYPDMFPFVRPAIMRSTPAPVSPASRRRLLPMTKRHLTI